MAIEILVAGRIAGLVNPAEENGAGFGRALKKNGVSRAVMCNLFINEAEFVLTAQCVRSKRVHMSKKSQQALFSEENIQKIFGHEAAEDESPERLREYYFKSSAYESVTADLALRILVGHKGIGKSALFTVAKAEDEDSGILTVALRPDDVLEIGNGPDDFIQQILQWKTGLTRVINRKILENCGAENLFENIGLGSPGRLLGWLQDTVKPYLSNKIDLKASEKVYADRFLKASALNVYIDDLDRGWKGSLQDVQRISALLNALRDMSNASRGLRFKVALRSDVYFLVRTADESTDKLESSVIWHSWDNHEILALLVKRILTYYGEDADADRLRKLQQDVLAQHLSRVMVPIFRGQGKWENLPIHRMLMTMVRKRPRDIVKLCTLAARTARESNHDIISTEDFRKNFEEYSQGRIQDTINEHRTELPEVERLIMSMKPSRRHRETADSYIFTSDLLEKKLKSIVTQGGFFFAGSQSKRPASTRELAAFLYKINFLTARKTNGRFITRKYFEENRYLSTTLTDFGFDWEIHPAYRWALQPADVQSLFLSIGPEEDELV
jgi:hypothetical protein